MASSGRLDRRTLVTVVVVAVAVVVGMLLISDDGKPVSQPTEPGKSQSHAMSRLVFAVWGSDEEVAAYERVVTDYNLTSTVVDVEVEAWPNPESMLAAIRTGAVEPDLYLLPRTELAESVEAERNRPLLDLLDARGISFGDDYPREAIAAFSANDDLQCLPYASSPMVIYYNTELIDFERMEERDLPVPSEEREFWSLDAFRAAAEFASRPRAGARGVYIEPSVEGLAPFVYSGGGDLFDDDDDPRALALSSDENAETLRQTLEVLRDPNITLTDRQLQRKPALDWFRQGKLGMIAGYRDLTPILRTTVGLEFDVMPMPQVDRDATVGDLVGLCVAEGPQERVEQSADVLVHLAGDEAVAEVAKTGYVMPTNVEVSFSDAFIQPGRAPSNARAFINATQSMELPPLIDSWPDLERAVAPQLRALLTSTVLDDLEADLAAIDESSRALLDPEQPEETDESDETDGPDDGGMGPTDDPS
jgi:multiple sugar transport system substrate-binding protein